MTGLGGPFVIGLLLGLIWSPCVGPTPGTAVMLATQREWLGQVATVMILFGLGAALPLALVGLASREAIIRWRRRMSAVVRSGKLELGVLLVAMGGAVLTGLDRSLESKLLRISPNCLEQLAVQF